MKLVFIHENEAWFWIFNDESDVWECWHEMDDESAIRIEDLDRSDVHYVVEIIRDMATAETNEDNVHIYV
jgi:hypothetical protein